MIHSPATQGALLSLVRLWWSEPPQKMLEYSPGKGAALPPTRPWSRVWVPTGLPTNRMNLYKSHNIQSTLKNMHAYLHTHSHTCTNSPAFHQRSPSALCVRVSEWVGGCLSLWSSLGAPPLLARCQLKPYAQAAASEERFEGSQKQPTPQEHPPALCLLATG